MTGVDKSSTNTVNHPSRRGFLKASATALGAVAANSLLPESIRKALAIEPNRRTGSLRDVEHIVIFMQENRSFDHYLGHLSGARGYNDRFPVALPSGLPVWFQPRREDPTRTIAPFRFDTTDPGVNAQCIGDLSHSWATTQAAMAGGKYDQWAVQKSNMTMGYHTREDLPFHYALADAFTVCDQYFCSIPGNTHPNRMYLMTGTIDHTGAGGGPLLDNTDFIDNQFDKIKRQPFTWTTYPERLQEAGVSWQVYQQGTGFDERSGNFGTNMLAAFANFVNAPAGSPLASRGMSTRDLEQLKADVLANALPQVSWLLPPAAFSEHPRYTPLYGAQYISMVLDALTANPEVWSKTAFFLTYDENDGFFDHVVPPQPPTVPGSGLSTVDIDAERHDVVNPSQAGVFSADKLPYGLGPRVPMTVISPWSKGGFVCSEVFDHTSLVRFIEKRFGVAEPNISPWRRAVCGDLVSAFDFKKRDAGLPPLPSTHDYLARSDLQCARPDSQQPPAIGAAQVLPRQEEGTRPTRPIPYDLKVGGRLAGSAYQLDFEVRGGSGACFWVYAGDPGVTPRRYTVETDKRLSDRWAVDATGSYRLSVHGPNGFFRYFAGAAAALEPVTDYDIVGQRLVLTLTNHGQAQAVVTVTDMAYGEAPHALRIAPGKSVSQAWHLGANANWYDLQLGLEGDASYVRRLAGHLETGTDSTTDPAATSPVPRTASAS